WNAANLPGEAPDQALPPAPPPVPSEARANPADAEQLQLMRELIHALAANVEERDVRQQEEVAALREQLQDLQRQANVRLAAAERHLVAQQLLLRILQKGENQ